MDKSLAVIRFLRTNDGGIGYRYMRGITIKTYPY